MARKNQVTQKTSLPSSKDILKQYKYLSALPDTISTREKANRGKQFEELLHQMLRIESMLPKASYDSTAEQIDGSFFFLGRCYLFEAKWRAHPMGVADIYPFKAKVDGRITGTIGVFFSISGISSGAQEILFQGKTTNLLIFESDEIEFAFQKKGNFERMLYLKLRYAAEQSLPFCNAVERTPKANSLGHQISISADFAGEY